MANTTTTPSEPLHLNHVTITAQPERNSWVIGSGRENVACLLFNPGQMYDQTPTENTREEYLLHPREPSVLETNGSCHQTLPCP